MKKKQQVIHRYDGGDEAFPRPSTTENCGAPGVDLLGHYAGLAMQGMLAHPNASELGYCELAGRAVKQAQALIDELNRYSEKP